MKNTLTRWQFGSLIIVSFIIAAVWFGAGILWERNRQAHLPRVFLRLPEFRTEQAQPQVAAPENDDTPPVIII